MDSTKYVGTAEFLNLTPLDLNPGIVKCEISVAYEGKNRNGSYIDHEAMESLAKSLRGTPIVGFFDEKTGDFGDHDIEMRVRNGEVEPFTRTVPFGFVPTDARVWFQDVVPSSDDFGESVRTYLMTEGYLWVKQFPHVGDVIVEGRPQSMELDQDTVNGSWADIDNTGYEFFIIEEGTQLSKLCILGKQVPPCFEDAAVTAPNSGINFSLNIDASCVDKLHSMMEELTYALRESEGGLHDMELENQEVTTEFEEEIEDTVEEMEGETETSEPEIDTEFTEDEDKDEETEGDGEEDTPQEEEDAKSLDDDDEDEAVRRKSFELEQDETEVADVADDFEQKKDEEEDEEQSEEPKKDDEDEFACGGKKRKYSLSDEEIDAIIAERDELRSFKLGIENAQKDALINKYYMLDEEDKADVISNKEKYSYEEIEEKLALAYVRKNVDFSTIDNGDNGEKETSTTFSLETHQDFVSPVAQALREARRNSKNY